MKINLCVFLVAVGVFLVLGACKDTGAVKVQLSEQHFGAKGYTTDLKPVYDPKYGKAKWIQADRIFQVTLAEDTFEYGFYQSYLFDVLATIPCTWDSLLLYDSGKHCERKLISHFGVPVLIDSLKRKIILTNQDTLVLETKSEYAEQGYKFLFFFPEEQLGLFLETEVSKAPFETAIEKGSMQESPSHFWLVHFGTGEMIMINGIPYFSPQRKWMICSGDYIGGYFPFSDNIQLFQRNRDSFSLNWTGEARGGAVVKWLNENEFIYVNSLRNGLDGSLDGSYTRGTITED